MRILAGASVDKLHRAFLAIFLAGGLFSAGMAAEGCAELGAICDDDSAGAFALIHDSAPAKIIYDGADAGVERAAGDLRSDLALVAGPAVALPVEDRAVILGVIGSSPIIDRLVAENRLDIAAVAGVWEGFIQAVIDSPAPGIDRALVIAGADKRGAIFGAYDISRRAGVSPWLWWADAPVRESSDLYVSAGSRVDAPSVRYRGIFLNDENPALYGWANEKFGGFNHLFYEKVFELILRLRGNYLWPAMWGKAFFDDDPANGARAAEMGVIIGTSHHEPMMRAHIEWERYGEGPWDYARNAAKLREFWREGVARAEGVEKIITIGMRGDGDEAMSDSANVALLEKIVRDQRRIIEDVTSAPAESIPQIWALYKEVQEYYDRGMRAPDDVTLLFADDNWGNIRRLPSPGDTRAGGYGVYYHFDYVGGPRNYKWINTTQIERVWEQMTLAADFGADRMWIVNIGDLKPMEFPIEFFLDLAWAPEDFAGENLREYSRRWAASIFGDEHADEIADMVDGYTKFNARRKPELLDAETFSITNFDEMARVTAEYEALAQEADALKNRLPDRFDDAYAQLVWFPIKASANLYEMYLAAAKNRLFASQGRRSANDFARLVEARFAADAELTRFYHEDIAAGKWNHMMSQTHIGYTYWQQPEIQTPPATMAVEPAEGAVLGVAIEGDTRSWPGAEASPVLPLSDPFKNQRPYIELFNLGEKDARFEIATSEKWIRPNARKGRLKRDMRVYLDIDWARAPEGETAAEIIISSPGVPPITVTAPVVNHAVDEMRRGHLVSSGYAAFSASACAAATDTESAFWRRIPNLGRTGDAVTAWSRVRGPVVDFDTPPTLEYEFHTFSDGPVSITAILSPNLDITGSGGPRFAMSIDDLEPVVVDIAATTEDNAAWEATVARNAHELITRFSTLKAGDHKLKVQALSPGLVFQRFVVANSSLPKSYLGPPDTAVRVETTCPV